VSERNNSRPRCLIASVRSGCVSIGAAATLEESAGRSVALTMPAPNSLEAKSRSAASPAMPAMTPNQASLRSAGVKDAALASDPKKSSRGRIVSATVRAIAAAICRQRSQSLK
jgi:hypothetical protein